MTIPGVILPEPWSNPKALEIIKEVSERGVPPHQFVEELDVAFKEAFPNVVRTASIGSHLRFILKSGMGGALKLLSRVWNFDVPFLPKIPESLKGLVWFSIVYVSYRYNLHVRVFQWLMKNLPLVREFVCFWRGPEIKPAKPDATAGGRVNGGRVMESARPGSNEIPLTKAKAQVLIGQYKNGNLESHGCGVRMRDFLVLPDHVLSYYRRVGETGKVFAFCDRVKTTVKPVELTDKPVVVLDTDLVYLKLTEQEWSVMGVGTMTILHEIPPNGVYSQIVGHAGLGTTGQLRHDGTCFGRVVYEASTFPGYSGAIYVVANRIAGIHQSGSDTVNGGYSASYIWATISHNEKMGEESTEDWLREQYFDNDNWLEIDQTWHGLDTARVRVKGRYHIVMRESLDNVFGGEWKGKARVGKRARRHYADFEADGLNGTPSLKSGDSGKLRETSPVPEGNPVLILTAGFKKLSDEQQREVLKELNYSRRKKHTPTGLLDRK